jgi:Outer membrane protein beta-barrel domain
MRLLGSLLLFAAVPCCFAQNWEVGLAGGYSWYNDASIKNPIGQSAKAGYESRFAAGAVLTENITEHIGGELRYMYIAGDSKLTSGGNDVHMDAQSQVVDYDFLFYATPRGSRFRPFAAAGAGIKRYDGTGGAFFPLYPPVGTFLGRGHQVEGMLSFGGGLKVALNDRWLVRVDFRDYATPLPDKLFVSPLGSHVSGWLQDFVPMFGVDWTFGGR